MEKKSLDKKLVIKLSGEALSSENNNFDFEKIKEYAHQIQEIRNLNYQVGVVVGAGNIWRNAKNNTNNVNRNNSDYIGMIATIVNGLLLSDFLIQLGVKTKIFSSIKIDKIAQPYNKDVVNESYKKGHVIIFVGGTGFPFFTTDTATALRAAELGATQILMGKNGVDGVYENDPNEFPNAKRFDKLTYQEVLDKEIKVMDKTAVLVCQENNIETLVFSANEQNCFTKVLKKKIKFTKIEN